VSRSRSPRWTCPGGAPWDRGRGLRRHHRHQEAALPLALRARTWPASPDRHRKTAAFLIAAFTRCLTHPALPARGDRARVLFIAPTRELGGCRSRRTRGCSARTTGLRILSVYGGIDYNKQREDLREGCENAVGTRPAHRLSQQHVCRRARRVLGHREADRMSTRASSPDLRFILRRCLL